MESTEPANSKVPLKNPHLPKLEAAVQRAVPIIEQDCVGLWRVTLAGF